MNILEITNVLKSLGWETSRDDVGDRLAVFQLLDRAADVIYGLRPLSSEQQLWAMTSITTTSFSEACAAVDIQRKSSTPLLTAWKGIRIQTSEILESHVRQASEEAIAWAKKQDLDKALQDHAALPTNAPGARPIWHLAALAVLGDVAQLRFYQDSFAAGDRLGFVNYVTKDYIDRAVELVEKNAMRH